MPELPDVEYFRKKSRKVLNKRMKSIRVNYKKLVKVSESQLRKHLTKNKFKDSHRHGKYLFLKTKDKKSLLLHFGMTGDVAYWKEDKPKYSAMDLELANGYTFSITSKRKLGKIDLIDDVHKALKNLGEDALSIDKKKFFEVIKKSKGQLKSVLMDQSKIAGIGNIYSDEILYQAKIHPKKLTSDLNENEIALLYNKMKEVLKTAIDANADPNKLPKNYLIPHRNSGDKVMGKAVKKITVNGRGTYFCPDIQGDVK